MNEFIIGVALSPKVMGNIILAIVFLGVAAFFGYKEYKKKK